MYSVEYSSKQKLGHPRLSLCKLTGGECAQNPHLACNGCDPPQQSRLPGCSSFSQACTVFGGKGRKEVVQCSVVVSLIPAHCWPGEPQLPLIGNNYPLITGQDAQGKHIGTFAASRSH
eukprot:1155728-Pelagomonas_calceolata.AAC.3